MAIRLEKMIPLPLVEQPGSAHGIWEGDPFIFETGKRCLVEAPSGKGKTSLLSIIYGIRNDYRGKVLLDDSDIDGFSPMQWSLIRKKRLSYIFQGLELFDELTALDNILLKNAMTDEKTSGQIREMSRRLGMEAFLQNKTGILSFGQQQRVAIIRALCQPFDFLLADECFSHMDRETSMEALTLITEECASRGAGLILTSLDRMEGVPFDLRATL
jgi:ABC-type lipoprotein export system ATPase subunit